MLRNYQLFQGWDLLKMNNLDCSSHSFELVIILYHVADRWIDKIKSKGDSAAVPGFLPPSQQA